MKPPPFAYHAPSSVADVISLLAEHRDDASVLAGGQSLLPLMNMRLARPEVVLDIGRVAELSMIDVQPDRVTIGAGVRLSQLESDRAVAEALPVLVEAIGFVAHPQIRNRTTVGGNICHADPASELPCVGVAMGARMHLRSERGPRIVEAEEFFESVFMTTRQPDELLVAVEFPRDPVTRFAFDEVARRHGDFPFVGLCLGTGVSAGETVVRAAAAGVADRPIRLRALEDALSAGASPAAVETAAFAASDEARPPDDQHGSADFRRGILRTLVRRLSAQLSEVAA